MVSVPGAERARESSSWRILLKTATLSTAAVAFYLLLRHTLLPRTFAAHPDLIVTGIILLWTWPVYSLIRRQTAHAQAQDPSTNPDESELQMLRAVIDSLPDLIYLKDTESRFLKKTSAYPGLEANPGLDREPGLSNIERSIFDSSPLPTATLAGTDHILYYVNPAFCRLAGKTKDELTGKPFAKVLTREGCLALLNRVYGTGEAAVHAEPEDPDAHSTSWAYTVWPIRGAGDRPVRVMMQVTETTRFHQRAIAMNEQLLLSGVRQHELGEMAERLNAQLQLEIAERKRMEGALVNSEKLAVTARFALTMAHEINNPLEAITNLIFLLAPLQTSSEAQSYVATIEDQLQGLSRIATHMLMFHRDSNRAAEFKLSAVLREILDFYRPQAERREIILHQRIETDGGIVAFRSEIVQVITNLLLNALDATPVRGQVVAHLYPAPSWLCEIHARYGYCLSIADSGTGVAPQDRARIFQPFFTTKGERGTGLGLWVSMSIINRIGGSMRVWSARLPGRSGTCFSIFLPVEQAIFRPLRRRRKELTEVQRAHRDR